VTFVIESGVDLPERDCIAEMLYLLPRSTNAHGPSAKIRVRGTGKMIAGIKVAEIRKRFQTTSGTSFFQRRSSSWRC
jgi:hypothetical protein